MPVDPELLDPFDRLITVRIEGREFSVPDNNSVLRIFQFVDIDLYPCRLCWNGECDNCIIAYRDPTSGEEVCARGCETVVWEGMEILRIPKEAVWLNKD